MSALEISNVLTKNKSIRIIILLFVLLNSTVYAGTLDSFESDISKEKENKPAHIHNNRHSTHDDSNDCDGFVGCLIGAIFRAFFETLINGMISNDSVEDYKSEPAVVNMELNDNPSPPDYSLFPSGYAGLSYRHSDDLYALSFTLQGGYRQFGFDFNVSRYTETDPEDHMTLLRLAALYRIPLGENFGISPGLGLATLSGNNNHLGMVFTMPVNYRIVPSVQLNFQPVLLLFNNHAAEIDVSVSYKPSKFRFDLGYHSLSSISQTIDGPYIGVSYAF